MIIEFEIWVIEIAIVIEGFAPGICLIDSEMDRCLFRGVAQERYIRYCDLTFFDSLLFYTTL
jgi:hypothetical protein